MGCLAKKRRMPLAGTKITLGCELMQRLSHLFFHQSNLDGITHRYCGDIAGYGRHWDYEHHVCFDIGTHQGNWCADVLGRKKHRYTDAVSHRSHYDQHYRRFDRCNQRHL